MRRLLVLFLLTMIAAPLAAQKQGKRDRYKIVSEELNEYGTQSIMDVIPKARPHFFMFNAGGTSGLGEATMSGVAARLLVYVGQQVQGDSSILRHYNAAEVKEIRYYKPSEAMTRLGADNAHVIQLILKPTVKHKS